MMYLSLLLVLVVSRAFAFLPRPAVSTNRIHRFMVPKYDESTQRWSDPSGETGYGPFGSLLRQGPLPFIQRLKDADGYDQGVLKMMATDSMSRNQAQGNMDAYLQNPNDWAFQKREEEKTGVKYDYENANMDPKQLVLTGVWATAVISIVVRAAYLSVNGCDDFCVEHHI
jgi:hypothetical protein